MAGPAFHIVDVFAQDRHTGNQLAVVESKGALSTDAMQSFAAEIDFSETTYIESADPPYEVRIFTPEEEIPFAGHPTLGTAHVLREHVAGGQPAEVVLDLAVGEIPVDVRTGDGQDTLWMTQQPPRFGEECSQTELASVLGLETAQLDGSWPIQVVSTGLPTIIVPLTDREALEAIELDRGAYESLTTDRDAKLVFAFCSDARSPTNDIAARMFAPYYGVPEDPATGSANGCLAAYLAHHEYFGTATVAVRVEQGYEMGRPSLLHLQADATGDEIDVQVGGRVVSVAHGHLEP